MRVAREGDLALLEIADDGIGGADPGRGSGLRGLVDRVEALDGRLDVVSPPARGTRVRASFPLNRADAGRSDPRSTAVDTVAGGTEPIGPRTA